MTRTSVITVVFATLTPAVPSWGEDLTYKDRLMAELVKRVPEILATFDEKTGRFGEGVWMSTDQNPMYALAVAYATNRPSNPHYRDAKLLDVIIRSGDNLIAHADAKGQWVFTKKDGSTWGSIWMPWVYSRWVRSFSLIRDDMPADARERWANALTLGYTGISETQLGHMHNIPTHHAMGLHIAGRTLERPEWCTLAADFMHKVAGEQSDGGYWSEGGGPVVQYNEVYVEALGIYYAVSGDAQVRPALERAAEFHRRFTYPSGQCVETIDQRNPYESGIRSGNVGFTFTPAGRAYLKAQWAALGMSGLNADVIASLLQFGEEGPITPPAKPRAADLFLLEDRGQGKAATLRQGPWFVCVSAYTTPISTSRWIQDRQNLLSVYHDDVGLVIGGGNTKLQPAWSSFTVGDESLLQHKPGDTDPNFLPPEGKLYHVPSAATLLREPALGLQLTYGPETATIHVEPRDERVLRCSLSATMNSGMPVAAHLTLLPRLGDVLETGGGERLELGETPIRLTAQQVGGLVTHAGWRLSVPTAATLLWPALPHNPYRKDGHAEAGEGRLSVRIPFDDQHRKHQILIEVFEKAATGDGPADDAAGWVRITPHAAFTPRDTAEDFVFAGKMWLSNGWRPIGGTSEDILTRDLWCSSDGITWTRVSENTPYDPYSEMVVYQDKVWAIKGSVWNSSDGSKWDKVLDNTPFGNRGYGEAAVFKDRIWQLGSGAEVWSTADGVNWTCAIRDAPYGDRMGTAVTPFDGKLWVMAGRVESPGDPPEKGYQNFTTYDDVWCSEDGSAWSKVLDEAPWAPRMWSIATVYAGRMWLVGGYDNRNHRNLGDVWSTVDGRSWERFESSAQFAPRHEVTPYVFENSLWVVAGNTWPVVNDVWRLTLPRSREQTASGPSALE